MQRIKEEIISEVKSNANKKQFEPEELPVINGAKEIQRIQEESGEDEILDIF